MRKTMKAVAVGAVAMLACGLVPADAADGPKAPAQGGPAPRIQEVAWMTCAEAWERAGRSDARAIGIVKAMAGYSLSRRGLALPDTREAGSRLGALIKERCAASHGELLLSIVDRSVRELAAGR